MWTIRIAILLGCIGDRPGMTMLRGTSRSRGCRTTRCHLLRSISNSSSTRRRHSSTSNRNISNRSISPHSSSSSRSMHSATGVCSGSAAVCSAGVCAGDAGIFSTTADGVCVFGATSAAGACVHVYPASDGDVFAATGDVLSEHDCHVPVIPALWIWLRVLNNGGTKSRGGALLISAPSLFSPR